MYSSVFTNWIHLSKLRLEQESESCQHPKSKKDNPLSQFFLGGSAGSSVQYGLSPVAACGGHPLVAVRRPLAAEASLVVGHGFQGARVSGHTGFSGCSSRALEHKPSGCGPSCSRACGIFSAQGSNCVSCIGRQILYHWATRKPASVVYTLDFGHEACGIFWHFNCGLVWVSLGHLVWDSLLSGLGCLVSLPD